MPEIWAGVDIGKEHHHCVVIDAQGERLDEVVTIGIAITGGITACVDWPRAMPLRICRPWSRYSACRAVRLPLAAPCLMSWCSGFLPASGIRSRSTISTAIRQCMTATVENS